MQYNPLLGISQIVFWYHIVAEEIQFILKFNFLCLKNTHRIKIDREFNKKHILLFVIWAFLYLIQYCNLILNTCCAIISSIVLVINMYTNCRQRVSISVKTHFNKATCVSTALLWSFGNVSLSNCVRVGDASRSSFYDV